MMVQETGGIAGFDPFSHRLDRDVRNTLGAAFIKAVLQAAPDAIESCALAWRRTALPESCSAYLCERLNRYKAVIAEIQPASGIGETGIACALWNRGLFFECHEWLEIFWHRAHVPCKKALQGWIMAAGVFSQLQSGRLPAARSLARKATARLSTVGHCLSTIENLDDLVLGLEADPPVAARLRLKS